jgi:hypothetical protein
MDDTKFHNSRIHGDGNFARMYSSNTKPLLQSLLSTLADIDFEYEQTKDRISKSSPDLNLRIRVLEKLKAQHQERRMPYIQQLAVLQERMMGLR